MEIEGGAAAADAGNSTNFPLLSEGCVAYILSHTSPRDACRASSISRGFKSFADSDIVWARFLPSDYQDVISRSVSPVVYSSKKELYFRLCDSPILLDDGNTSFFLNKHNGKKCFLLGAKELSIAWQDTLVFWRWRPLPESRFPKVAELLAVCWLEIRGRFKTRILSIETTYAAYLVFNIAPASYGLEFPGKTLVRLVGGKEDVARTVVCLRPPTEGIRGVSHPQRRADGWMEIELGKFYNGKTDGEVDMRFMEMEGLHWKSGLIVEGIDIRPANE